MSFTLRPYQLEAVEGAFREWQENDSTLIVMPTGSGKSLVFADIIARVQPKRAMVVAHRKELIAQARETIESHANLECEIEQGELMATTSLFHRTPVVVAMVQSLISGSAKRRFERFDPQDFGLLVIDEFHHAVSDSYRAVINHFRQNADLKVLGVTATPDRADEEALGQICDSVAYDYEILDAIHDGWLVPVEQEMVSIQGLDFSGIRTTAGDLNGADLAAVMENEQNMQGVVGASIQICGDKRTILFACSVMQAQIACAIFNRHRQGMAGFVHGKTPDEERAKILKMFGDGSTQILCNCGVATEGFDVPAAEICLMARPTKSRSLYAQMAGRCTRPLPGIVDRFDLADDRKAAIAASLKPSCQIVDFVGNSGRHKLMTTADILGGKLREEVVELAAKMAREGGRRRMDELLDEAEQEIEDQKRKKEEAERKERERLEFLRKKRVVATVKYASKVVSPFDVWDITPVRERGWDSGKHLSEKQRALLVKQGMDPDSMPYAQARQVIAETFRRWDGHLATYKQSALLKRFGYETKDLPMKEASRLIDALVKNGWKRPAIEPPIESAPSQNRPIVPLIQMSWIRVTREAPCGVCHKPNWCCKGDLAWNCMRISSDKEARNGGWLHFFEKRLNENGFRTVQYGTGIEHQVSASLKHLPREACAKMLCGWQRGTGEEVDALGRELCLSTSVLRDLDCAWASSHRAFAFPMRDHDGFITGFRLRGKDGRKYAVKGSKAGLFIPLKAAGRLPTKRIFICEGPTDAAALLSIGLFAIGRPACLGQEEETALALKGFGAQEAVIVSDNDGPGLRGAERLARAIHCRKVMFCPPAKDARAFVNSGATAELVAAMLSNSLWKS